MYYEEYKSHGPSFRAAQTGRTATCQGTTAGPSEAEEEQRIPHGSEANDARGPPGLVAMHWRTRGS